MHIVYQDDAITAIYKPAGLLVHRTPLDKWEKDSVLDRLEKQFNKKFYSVHRLDRPTSGLLLLANNATVASNLSRQFREGFISKKYIAVVRGYLENSGIIDYALTDIKNKDTKLETKNIKTKKEAITNYKNLANIELPFKIDKFPTSRYSIIELEPKTGRMHQLRRHLKHISHPIIGDTCYGKSIHNSFFKDQFSLNELLLCSVGIYFCHPQTGKEINLETSIKGKFGEWVNNYH